LHFWQAKILQICCKEKSSSSQETQPASFYLRIFRNFVFWGSFLMVYAADKFKEISDAYSILSTVSKGVVETRWLDWQLLQGLQQQFWQAGLLAHLTMCT
jgi:hypothetical protein